MKRFLLYIYCLIGFVNLYSQTYYDSLVECFVSNPDLKSASISLYAENISKGEVIIDYNSYLSLVPASVFKIIPTALSLELMGSDKRFKTDLAYSGTINTNGDLDGNIYIIGFGDPSLDSRFFANHYNGKLSLLSNWINAIKELGIKRINGDIICDVSYFGKIDIPKSWLWEDIANYYASQASALCFRDNMYELHFKTSNQDNGSTEIKKIIPNNLGLRFNNEVISSASVWDDAYIYYTSEPNVYTVKGKLRWKKDKFVIKGAIPNPELYLIKSFIEKIQTEGIVFTGSQKIITESDLSVERKVFYSTESPKLADIVELVNVKSNNLFAEVLSYQIEKITKKKYSDAVKDFFVSNDIDTNGLNVEDACGLSRLNLATSRQFVGLLKYMKIKSKNSDVFFKSLPVAGRTGTLSTYSLAGKAQGAVSAKSGSMTRVLGYAGYINDSNNDDIAFCFIVNNYNCKQSVIKKIYENLFLSIVLK